MRHHLISSFATLLLALIGLGSHAVAQPGERPESARQDTAWRSGNPNPGFSVSPGEVKLLYLDRRIAALDSMKVRHPSAIKGYRLQLFFGDRAEARKRRAEFSEKFPHIPSYISYLAPNFRLRVGDFRTRMEVEKLKRDLGRDYPGAYIVKDAIELPELRPAEQRMDGEMREE